MLKEINQQQYSDAERRSIALLRDLIRTRSLTGEEMPGQKVIAEMLADAGAKIEWLDVDTDDLFEKYPDIAQYPSHWQHDLILPYDNLPTLQSLAESGLDQILTYDNRPNVVARWDGAGGGKSLILNGHIDTVTVEPLDDWTRDPFGAEIIDGNLYGRGSVDMKGGVAAAIAAMAILQERGVKLKGDVILQSVVNEEHSGNGTLDLVRRGIKADAAIVLEPTSSKIMTGSSGGLYWTIDVPGVVRAPSARWVGDEMVGVSAIEMLAPVINALKQIERDCNDQSGAGVFSLVIGQVSGGHYDTATAGSAVLRGVAYFSDELGDVSQIMERFRSVTDVVAKEIPFLAQNPAKVKFLHHDDATRQLETPRIAEELSSFLAQKGMDSEITPGNFACDVRHLVNRGNIPSIVFGPGDISQAHKVDEHIHVRDYLDFIDLLVEFIPQWCNADKENAP